MVEPNGTPRRVSRIDDLIPEHCPDGVEFKTLGEIGSVYGGLTGPSKKDFNVGIARFVSSIHGFKRLSRSATNDAVDLLAASSAGQ